MILLSTLIVIVIKHLICDINYNWFLNLNMINGKLWTGAGSDLLILMLENLNWFCLTGCY